jgi:acyl-[acyl-carrier-protein]-phospholipid O-acyltransferase/long-chain-fatty-acid--[acyl-carrier-protein] ligase
MVHAPGVRRRGFFGLMVSQSLGAFNDHAFKMLILLGAAAGSAQPGAWTKEKLLGVTGIIFMIPLVFFSMPAGVLSDRFSKKRVLVWTKLLEVLVMASATVGFALGHVELLLGLFFFIALQATLYSPAKFGILPELLTSEELSLGNGLIELFTFVMVILGLVIPPFLKGWCGGTLWVPSALLTGLAGLGLVATFLVPPLQPAAPDRKLSINPFTGLGKYNRLLKEDRALKLSVVGMVFFWAVSFMLLQNSLLYADQVLHLGEKTQTLAYIALAVGVGIGSGLAGVLSDHKVELGLVPLGTFGMLVFSVLLAFMDGVRKEVVLPMFALLGASGGFFIVPLNALLQQRSPDADKGGLVAASNFYQAIGMALTAVVFMVLTDLLHVPAKHLFLLAGGVTLIAAVYSTWLLPEALARFVLWMLARTVYRMKVVGRENIPAQGPALLVCNHVSLIDGLLVLASTHRFVRFIMEKSYAEVPVARWLYKALRVIPISTTEGPKVTVTALREASKALQEGHVVCIFAEGEMSRTGLMLPFRPGVERILRDAPEGTPIVPIQLDRVWGSIFSFEGGRFGWKWPRRLPYPVTVSIGKPLPSSTSVFQVRQAIQELGAEAFAHRRAELEPLHRAFIRTARRLRGRQALADSTGATRTFGDVLVRAILLARALREKWRDQEMVGLLLPPTAAGATANVAALLSGRVPVNLNYTASPEILRSCLEQCKIRTVLTSKAFLEHVKIELPCEMILMEDLGGSISTGEKLGAWFAARFRSARGVERYTGRTRDAELDDLATVIFSSGSTGDPKGVMLTHANITSNLEGLSQIYDLGPKDGILGILPFFHSFGFTGTLWWPLIAGVRAIYHVNPVDAKAVGTLVREHGATVLLATPTFLQTYTRRCEPGDFGSLKHAFVGAEKLTDRIADAFKERFGIEPFEGYGCTECSPIVTLSGVDYRARGFRQVAAKRGRIGHPLPGVCVKIVDPDTGAPRPPDEPGMLMVKGPNVMKGYLGKPELSAQVLREGWYVTGDIAKMEEDGFIILTDRLSRFSKIGGEMVPHIKVEEALHGVLSATETMLVVTGVPDEKKGERLVVMHTLDDSRLQGLLSGLNGLGLPNLWVPREDAFFRMPEIPLLGTGKLDLRKVKQQALAAAQGPAAAKG